MRAGQHHQKDHQVDGAVDGFGWISPDGCRRLSLKKRF